MCSIGVNDMHGLPEASLVLGLFFVEMQNSWMVGGDVGGRGPSGVGFDSAISRSVS